MGYSLQERTAIVRAIGENRDKPILKNIAMYIFYEDLEAKDKINGENGYLSTYNADEIRSIRDHINAWANGSKRGELDATRLETDQNDRWKEMQALFSYAYSEKMEGAPKPTRRTPPDRALPVTPVRTSQRGSKRGSQRASVEVVVDPHIVHKNALINDLIQERYVEVANDKVKGQAHFDREFALDEIQAYIKTHYTNNSKVIDLDVIEDAIREKLKHLPAQLTQFNNGTSAKSSSVVSVLKPISEYAKMKTKITEIKDAESVSTHKKKHGR